MTVAQPAAFTLLYSSIAGSFSFHFSEDENFTTSPSQPPRTGSRYIPEDVFAEIPKLLAFIGTQPEWKDKVRAKAAPTRRSVDDGKVTDHHALLVMPQSFIACRSASSSISLPAVSIAESRVASVCSGDTPQRGRRQGDRPPCPARHG